MRAVVYDRYGSPDVLKLTEIDKPVVRDDQVLVRVRAASVNPADWHFMRGLPYLVRMINGLRRPRKATVLASDLAGQVEAVGKNVTRFRPGDQVFGRTRAAHRPDRRAEVATGGCAEYACVPDDLLGLKPANLTFEQAAAVPLAALTALQALRDKGSLQAGQKVLINGASGGVGTFAVQIARSFGAEVTGVCSTPNVDMVRSIGAGQVIDYTQQDFAKDGRRYDLILDAGDRSLSDLRCALTPKGDSRRHRRIGRSLDRRPGPREQGARVVTIREPAAAPVPYQMEQAGPEPCERAHRGRQGHAGHRPDLPVESGPRGDPAPGRRPRPREDCHHGVKRDPARASGPARYPGLNVYPTGAPRSGACISKMKINYAARQPPQASDSPP